MGKIIMFRAKQQKHTSNTKGVKLYYDYFKTASEVERNWTIQMISVELHKSTTDRSFTKIMSQQDVMELYGYAAAKRQTKQTWAISAYHKKLAEVISKYGIEVLANVRTN